MRAHLLALNGTRMTRQRYLSARATLCRFSSGRYPDEREDARAEAGLRVGRLHGREDHPLERECRVQRAPRIGNVALTFVRPLDALREMLASDPYRGVRLNPAARRIVTFLRDKPTSKLALPIELEGARILAVKGREVFSAYVPNPKGPVFMTLIERTFGKDVTTRTWETVAKVTR